MADSRPFREGEPERRTGRVHGMKGLLAVAVAFVVVVGAPAARAQDSHSITNCALDRNGEITLLSPQETAAPQGLISVQLRGRCLGGIPMSVGVDGVRYRLSARGKLVAAPHFNPGCRSCWPQLGVIGSPAARLGRKPPVGEFKHDLALPAGRHTMVIRPGIQGTDLPQWRPFRASFTVGGGQLATTGATLAWIIVGAVLVLTGSSLLALARAKRA